MAVESEPRIFANIGLADANTAGLECVSRLVCYVEGNKGNANDILMTADGGRSWAAGAELPMLPSNENWSGLISCQSPLTCMTAYGTGILTTADGFAHATFQQLVAAPDSVTDASCATAQDCVASILSMSGASLLMYSHNGGATWTDAQAPALPLNAEPEQLQCDADGACIGVVSGGDEENATVAAIGSIDGGQSWTVSPFSSLGSAQWIRFSCGSGQDCVMATNTGGLAWLSMSAAGALNVRIITVPGTTMSDVYQAVSCPSGPVCYAEVSDWTGFAYANTILSKTANYGQTWSSLGDELVTDMPNASVVYLSCPVNAGCIGIGGNNNQIGTDWLVFSDLQH
ncbi:MAG: hypothetical protein WBH47_08350 [Streptosporangiaceae bacterium]